MKAEAVFFTRPGKAEIREWDCPDPSPGQVQVRCVANGICMGEVSLFTGRQHGVDYPRAVGHEGVGMVTKVPHGITHLKEGDFVDCFGWSSIQNLDAWRVNKFRRPPVDPAVCIVEPASCVVTALHSYEITPGDRVLLLGAGYMGLLNVQGLGRYPLQDLVVVDIKARNLALASEFGATETVQPGTPDGDERMRQLISEPFDLVVEAAAAACTLQQAGDYCRQGGRLAIFAWHHEPRAVNMTTWHLKGLTVLNSAPGIGTDFNLNSMGRAVRLIERGVFDMHRLITHRHSFTEAQEAMELAAERPEGYIKGVLMFN
jgi:L-iditol 2-dehydrogenase